MAKVSVLIPARNEPFLQKTIDEVFAQATGEVECIVMLDGMPAVTPLREDPRLIVLQNSKPKGIAWASWDMAQVAEGKYIMKLDSHCALGLGYDEALQADCEDDWLVVPSRYQLLDETWTCGYGPIDYLYFTYPWISEPMYGSGLHGKKWIGESGLEGSYFWKEQQLRHLLIDDLMTFQGSLFFMNRAQFLKLDGVDRRYTLWQEATSIGMKVWMSGGRCIRNKKTWYAHLHKGQRHGRGYRVGKAQANRDAYHSADMWMNDRWEGNVPGRNIHWFVDHFWPIPGWPEDWNNPKYQANSLYPGMVE